jgi:hypothetical protein
MQHPGVRPQALILGHPLTEVGGILALVILLAVIDHGLEVIVDDELCPAGRTADVTRGASNEQGNQGVHTMNARLNQRYVILERNVIFTLVTRSYVLAIVAVIVVCGNSTSCAVTHFFSS